MSGWPGRLFGRRPRASTEQASQLMRQGAILLDVREAPNGGPGTPPAPGTSRSAAFQPG